MLAKPPTRLITLPSTAYACANALRLRTPPEHSDLPTPGEAPVSSQQRPCMQFLLHTSKAWERMRKQCALHAVRSQAGRWKMG